MSGSRMSGRLGAEEGNPHEGGNEEGEGEEGLQVE